MKRLLKEQRIIKTYANYVGNRNLVIGCGIGSEIRNLAGIFPCTEFVGIDPLLETDLSGKNWSTTNGRAENLNFRDEEFDFIYCYHVLEHVQDTYKVMNELKRVVKIKGAIFIGVPNKSRIVSYISSEAKLKEKLLWNLNDYQMKLRGKFENSLGAHAGFTKMELENLFTNQGFDFIDVTNNYYFNLYNSRILRKIIKYQAISRFLLPSLYYIAKK